MLVWFFSKCGQSVGMLYTNVCICWISFGAIQFSCAPHFTKCFLLLNVAFVDKYLFFTLKSSCQSPGFTSIKKDRFNIGVEYSNVGVFAQHI